MSHVSLALPLTFIQAVGCALLMFVAAATHQPLVHQQKPHPARGGGVGVETGDCLLLHSSLKGVL